MESEKLEAADPDLRLARKTVAEWRIGYSEAILRGEAWTEMVDAVLMGIKAARDDAQTPPDHLADASKPIPPADEGEFVMVPREATEAMIDRFVSRALCVSVHGDGGWSNYAREQWAAMIAAAPASPSRPSPSPEQREVVARQFERIKSIERALANGADRADNPECHPCYPTLVAARQTLEREFAALYPDRGE